jgi:hypothetical protein
MLESFTVAMARIPHLTVPLLHNRLCAELLHHVAAAVAVMNCLQDFREEIRSDACKSQVHKYVELAAQDIRFDVPLADACYNDRMTLCAAVPPVSCCVCC